MKSLYYISVQPTTTYYAWQVEVMLNNFLKHNIPLQNIHILCATKGTVPIQWNKLKEKFKDIQFFFYEDLRQHPLYVSSIRPHVLKRHFTEHPYLVNEAIFYHDCDIVFTQPVSWEQFCDDDVWYLSDTASYIGANYIKSKKFGVYERMCEIIGIPENVPEENEIDSGGAQYIMKNVDATFWDKVERDSEKLYEFFIHHLKAFPESSTYHPIQMWTADMWAVLWNAWYFNHKTKVVPEMEFSWPVHPIHDWEKKKIFHNSGVIPEQIKHGIFYKGNYMNKLPYNIQPTDFSMERCTYKYVEEILETSQNSCLL